LSTISVVPVSPFPQTDLAVTYTDFNKIASLSEGLLPNKKDYTITYGVDDQRSKSVYSVNNVVKQTRYYLGDYEEEVDKQSGNVRKIHYLSGANGLAAIYVQYQNRDSLLYAYTDNQGSLTALTNESGTVVENYAYDPWGARRNATDWNATYIPSKLITNRGYTLHEHIDAFGIINMNGRVYDPLTAMFFSPDPLVQAPDNWLNYNRYTYCLNNPMKYTDPSGYAYGDDYDYGYGGGNNYGGDWFSSYMDAASNGYDGTTNDFQNQYYNQITAPGFNGTLNLKWMEGSYSGTLQDRTYEPAFDGYKMAFKLDNILGNGGNRRGGNSSSTGNGGAQRAGNTVLRQSIVDYSSWNLSFEAHNDVMKENKNAAFSVVYDIETNKVTEFQTKLGTFSKDAFSVSLPNSPISIGTDGIHYVFGVDIPYSTNSTFGFSVGLNSRKTDRLIPSLIIIGLSRFLPVNPYAIPAY
jgi:RHS repeat-associated protein